MRDYRIRIVPDPDGILETPDGEPLPGSRETYDQSPIYRLIDPEADPRTGARRRISYEEYCQVEGNPDRHVVVGVMIEQRCQCCQQWRDVASLWNIDLYDTDPDAGYVREQPYTLAEVATWPSRLYLRDVVADLLAEVGASITQIR